MAWTRIQFACQNLNTVFRVKKISDKSQGLSAQSRFSSSIRANNCNARIKSDIEVNVLEYGFIRVIAEGDFIHLEKRWRNLLHLRESTRRLIKDGEILDHEITHLKFSFSSSSGGCKSGNCKEEGQIHVSILKLDKTFSSILIFICACAAKDLFKKHNMRKGSKYLCWHYTASDR